MNTKESNLRILTIKFRPQSSVWIQNQRHFNVDLHKEADILTQYQKSFYDNAVTFWRIINNCKPSELFMDLLLQGSHNRQQHIFHIQQSNTERVGKFSFVNRLTDIIPLLGDGWLDKSEYQMKKTLKTKILETVPAKCDD